MSSAHRHSLDAEHWLIVALVALTLWRLAIASLLPATQDEAYYFDWARSLAWGYFDHPPGVAVLGLGTWLAPASALAARIGNLLAATAALLALLAFFRRCGLQAPRDQLLALVIALATLPGLAGGILTTPDTALALAWILALHEALAALQGERWRWLTAGAVVGLGLLGKYTMVLVGPVLLWALLRADPRALRTPWPYLGATIAFLVFLPHVLWNADHDWVTMRFQLGHGLSVETGPLVDPRFAPATDAPSPASSSAAANGGPRWMGLVSYLGTQIALYGLLALPIAASLIARSTLARRRDPILLALDPQARPLLLAGALVPLLFFGVFAWRSDVEPNWPVVYLFAAAPILAIAARPWRRWVFVAAAGNLALVSLYALHGATGSLPLAPSHERILRETHGFRELATRVRELEDAPIFTDRYQTTAMLRFYAPGLAVAQWPGLTRPSEYLRGQIGEPIGWSEIQTAGGFWLVTQGPTPTQPGLERLQTVRLYDCRAEGLIESEEAPCAHPLHMWELRQYRTPADAAARASNSSRR